MPILTRGVPAGGSGGGGGAGVPATRNLTAGDGLTGGGDLSADRAFDVVANADGSIVVNPNDVQVGVLATDVQHGIRGGSSLHALVIAAGAAGFMGGADKTKLDGIADGAQPDQDVVAGAGMTGGGATDPTTLDVIANADGSVVVNANDIQVGVLASDAQHGGLGGGSLHALVIAGGAAGFMAGADKTKLDGIPAGASDTFAGLTDTAGAIAASEFARANAGGTSVDFFDLFGTANTWSANQTMGAHLLADTDATRDMGTIASKFRQGFFQTLTVGYANGSGTFVNPATTGGILVAGQNGGGGTTSMVLSGSYPPIAILGNVYALPGMVASQTNNGGGSVIMGSAFAGYGTGAGKSATMEVASNAYGAFCGGYAFASGAGVGDAQVNASGSGSFVWGYSSADGAGTSIIESTSQGNGSFVQGRTTGGGINTIRAAGQGSFVQGFVQGAATGTIESTNAGDGGFAQGQSANGGMIRSIAPGGFAQGNAGSNGGLIEAGAAGATAIGNSGTNDIVASGAGSFASGDATAGNITASALNAFQWGVGVNALADSMQIGNAGLRLKGTANAPGTPQDGDFWRRLTFVEMRSDGVTWTFDQSPAFTPTNVVIDRAFDANATTVAELADVLGTLIADLQTIGALG